MRSLLYGLVVYLFCVQEVSGFTPLISPAAKLAKVCLFSKKISDESDFSFPEETEYTGSIDWDAEWKKVVKEKQKTKERPGSGYYKTEAEIVAIRAANKASEEAARIVRKVPTWNDVKGDWRVWVGVLAVISVGLSVLSAPETPPSNIGSSSSYYI